MNSTLPGAADARSLALNDDMKHLVRTASAIRDRAYGNLISYSRKVFIPLTHLCRDVCYYCTFARVPSKSSKLFMSVEEVLEVARQGAAMAAKRLC